MKLLSRNFTTKEIILVVLLGIMLLGLVYYKFVFVQINTALNDARAEAQTLQSDLDVANAKVMQAKRMEKELNGIGNTGLLARMGSYNNSKPETAFLHTVLADVSDYSVSFDEVTRDGDQIRRNFTLQYTTPSYSAAEATMKELESGEYRCLISDVDCSVDDKGVTKVSLIGTFYETMVGGTPDSALPVDEANDETVKPVELSDFE